MSTSIVAISNRTIVAGGLVLLAAVTAFALRDVLVLVFVSVVLAAALNPAISKVARAGISRRWGVALVLLGVAAVIFTLTITVAPLIISEFSQFLNALPTMLNRFSAGGALANLIHQVTNGASAGLPAMFSRLGAGIFQGTLGVFAGLLSFLAMMALMYYFTVDERSIRGAAIALVPMHLRPAVEAVVEKIEQRLGHWLRGQLLLGLIIGTAVSIGLSLLHVKYALALGLIAGVTELIPTIGPYLGMIPAVLVGFSQAPLTAVWVFLLYWAIQQAENNFLVPRIMSKATGLNPIVVLIGILIGAKLAGIIGIILSIPLVIIISSISEVFLTEREGAMG